jgi:hypothetical protein
MNREELVTALKKCRPALASNDLIPVLSHYCFDKDRVFAYNDVMCIAVEVPVGIRCALPGDPLYRIIESFSSEEVFLEQQKTDVLVRGKTKKSKVVMPFLPPPTYLYRDPLDSNIKQEMDLTEEFVNGLQFCLDSVPDNALLPYQMGVTLAKDGFMYASDGTTVAYAEASMGIERAIILPAAFCKQVVSLFTEEDAGVLFLGSDFAIAEFNPGVMVFTKLPFDAEVGRFEKVIDDHIPAGPGARFFDIPKQLAACLDRCLAVLSSDLEKTLWLRIDKEGFAVHVESKLGVVDEVFTLATGVKKDMEQAYDVEVFRKCVLAADKVAFLSVCIAMISEDAGTRLIAQRHSGE